MTSTNNGLPTHLASTLSYLFVPAIVFMVLEPYKEDKVIRQHAWHSVVISVAWMVVFGALSVLLWIPGLNVILSPIFMLAYPILSLGALVMTVMLMWKAYQGDMLRLPVLTSLAEQYSTR